MRCAGICLGGYWVLGLLRLADLLPRKRFIKQSPANTAPSYSRFLLALVKQNGVLQYPSSVHSHRRFKSAEDSTSWRKSAYQGMFLFVIISRVLNTVEPGLMTSPLLRPLYSGPKEKLSQSFCLKNSSVYNATTPSIRPDFCDP